MKVITHDFGAVTLHLVPEVQIGPEVQSIFDGLSLERLSLLDWLFPHHVTPGGDLISLSQCLVVRVGARIVLVDTCIGTTSRDRISWPGTGCRLHFCRTSRIWASASRM